MRRATVVALAFIAALAAPVRAACGATCVQPPVELTPAAPACHETAAEPKPSGTPIEHCSHDHSTSVRPAPKAGGDTVTAQPFALAASTAPHPIVRALASLSTAARVSRGSPPLALNPPLRI